MKRLKLLKISQKPRSLKDVQSILGLSGYFRKFIPNFAKIAKPLSDFLRKDMSFAFKKIKKAPFLSIYRRGAVTELQTDASKYQNTGSEQFSCRKEVMKT